MKAVMMTAVLFAAALMQSMLPGWGAMGQARFPLLLGVVLYAALTMERRGMLLVAFTAGLLQDALSLLPIGFSSFGLCFGSLLIFRWRDQLFGQQAVTHILLGGVFAAFTTLLLYILLMSNGTVYIHFGSLVLRLLGSFIMGVLAAPVVFLLLKRLELALGLKSIGEEL
jgi:rod shape-determining protein MreD